MRRVYAALCGRGRVQAIGPEKGKSLSASQVPPRRLWGQKNNFLVDEAKQPMGLFERLNMVRCETNGVWAADPQP